MGNFGIPELAIIVGLLAAGIGIFFGVRAERKKRAQYPHHYPPPYPPPYPPSQGQQYPPPPGQQYPPRYPAPGQPPHQGPYPPRQGPWR